MKPYAMLFPVSDLERNERKFNEEELRSGVRQTIETYAKEGMWGFQIGNEPPGWGAEQEKRNVEAYRVVYEEAKKRQKRPVMANS